MNTTQITALELNAAPTIVEALSIDELAVREEYAACLTITK